MSSLWFGDMVLVYMVMLYYMNNFDEFCYVIKVLGYQFQGVVFWIKELGFVWCVWVEEFVRLGVN